MIYLPRKAFIVVVGPHAVSQTDLLQVAHASDALGFGFRFGESGQEEACEDGDNGDHDKQFDERESLLSGDASMVHNLFLYPFWERLVFYFTSIPSVNSFQTLAALMPAMNISEFAENPTLICLEKPAELKSHSFCVKITRV